MSRNLFGWSYPPGCSGPPEDEEPIVIRCEKCRGFLKHKPDKTEPVNQTAMCDGKEDEFGAICSIKGNHKPHEVIMDTYTKQTRKCEKCGHVNMITVD